MTMIKTTGGRFALPALVGLALLITGCGTKHVGSTTAGTAVESPAKPPAPTVPADFPCPGESPRPTPTAATTSGPPDKWTENNGFKIPIPLHGQARCDGLAAVKKIQDALEPQRKRGDFAPETARTTLTGLGYAKVRTYQNGPTGVGFLIAAGPSLCLEGTMGAATTSGEAFAGYPEGSIDCERPRGGH
ncbi:hypothetical protein PUR71_25210 [Streptomyces sp. SP17BM10]|uniref:hypothetical protein n=1 Tax=Streptomyces sp. SP17BM10 TaxID=3002530 RepID=UPI002E76089B|nr:hypothetical protein [Streptomyces sp. SP17BM10]MEE1786173.1 hypothetical protein [Streptomyces sp. SP17BM10]